MALRFCMFLLLGILTSAVPAAAQEEVSCEGPLQEDSMRYPNMRVVPRAWRDLAALPGSIPSWDEGDWSRMGAFTLPTFALMAPAEPSFDLRIQRWVKRQERPGLERFYMKLKTKPESLFLASYGAALFSVAWLTKSEHLFEYATLALETLAMVQFYHVVTKVLVGREGPYQTDGDVEPRLYGPTKLNFPGGTPSGHAATAWSMLFVLADYYGHWPLYALAFVAGTYVSTALIYERQHYLSDVIWGAGLGIYIARWVVKHRSSRYRCRKGVRIAQTPSFRERMMIMPVGTGPKGFGLMFSLQL